MWRLATQTPERLSRQVLRALCDILNVTPTVLIVTRIEKLRTATVCRGWQRTASPALGELRPDGLGWNRARDHGRPGCRGNLLICREPAWVQRPELHCPPCRVPDQQTDLLDSGTGTVHLRLAPLTRQRWPPTRARR